MVKYIATSGLFGIKDDGIVLGEQTYFLYWCDAPLHHLTQKEFDDLKLLLNTI